MTRRLMPMACTLLLMSSAWFCPGVQAAEVTYEVDKASGRVEKAIFPDGSYITYSYDPNGNRTSAIVTDLGDPTAPGEPSFSSVGSNSASVSWAASTDNVKVTGYEYRLGTQPWVSVTSTSVSLSGLAGATTYAFAVRAKDASDNYSPESSGSFTTLDNGAPSAPGTPTFAGITATSATASWTAATDDSGIAPTYEYLIDGVQWQPNGTALSVSLSGLTTATSYNFRVRARDAAQNPGPETSGSFTTLDNQAPTAPGTPTFSSITQSGAIASWTASTDNVEVAEYRYSLDGLQWTSNGTGLSVTLGGLNASTSYTMRVQARDDADNFSSISSGSFSTIDSSPPGAPGQPEFSSITETTARADWSAASDNVGVVEYQYSLNGAEWASNGTLLYLNLTGLIAGTNNTLQVRARDAANLFSSVSSNSFTTADSTAPGAPGTPSFSSITGTSASVTWSAATDNVGVTAYQYRTNGGSLVQVSGPPVSLSGLSQATTFTVEVRARDAVGLWGPFSSNSFTTLDTSAPSAPGTPTFSNITATSATASWSAASDNVGVTGYEWHRTGGSWTSSSGSPASLTGLSPATTYTFQVRARDAAGNWGSVSSASFTTPAAVTISNRNVTTHITGAAVAQAHYQLQSSGDIMASMSASTALEHVGDWLSPKSGMSNFQVRQASGNCAGVAVGSWVASGNWLVTANSPQTIATCSMTIQIRAVSNPSEILGSAFITLQATRP